MKKARAAPLFRFILGFYFPFVALLALALVAILALLGWAAVRYWFFAPLLVPVIVVFGFTLVQFLWAVRIVAQQPPPANDLELPWPRKGLRRLYELVENVAREHDLPAPDEIRLAPDTVAYVYENEEDQRILVIGGLAMTLLTQQALAGVVAHELAHFAAGDTRLSRRGYRRGIMIGLLEYQFRSQRGSFLNPLVWLLRLYHLLYAWVSGVYSRQQEFAADRHSLAEAGKWSAATTLLHVTLLEQLPYVRLSDIAEASAEMNEAMDRIFAEHHRRAQGLTPADWQDALRTALAQTPSPFDTHPPLRQRLAALGVSPRKALRLALESTGAPARELLPEWDTIEKRLTEQLMLVYHQYEQARREAAQIMLGRPLP